MEYPPEKNNKTPEEQEAKPGFSEKLEQIDLDEKSDAFFTLYLLEAYKLLPAEAHIKSPEDFEMYLSLHPEELSQLHKQMLTWNSGNDSETFQSSKEAFEDLFTTINDGKEVPVKADTGAISRVVGTTDKEVQLQASMQIDFFKNEDISEIRKLEMKKTPEEMQALSLINQEINNLRSKYDLPIFEMNTDDILCIKSSGWKKVTEEFNVSEFTGGFWNKEVQKIFLAEESITVPMKSGLEKSLTAFSHTVFHESIHRASHNAVSLHQYEDIFQLGYYRIGLDLLSKKPEQGNKRFFEFLNEGITEELTKNFVESMRNNPLFLDETKETQALFSEAEKKGFPPEEFVVLKAGTFDDDGSLFFSGNMFTYLESRGFLKTITEILFEKNKEKFKDQEEVFVVFEKAAFTRSGILSLGKLIDGTFGVGTFRKIAELNDTNYQEFLESIS